VRVLLTGDRSGYYQEFGSVAELDQGHSTPPTSPSVTLLELPPSGHLRRPGPTTVGRSDSSSSPPNHDQVGNPRLRRPAPVDARGRLAASVTLLSRSPPKLFQGEEHGETAPFQFFTDHIDEEIAVATREGRRREFAAFAGEEVPDPQDPATFERSKLTRTGEPAGMRELYRDLIAARRRLPQGDADDITADEASSTLRVRRGPFELVCNFGDAPVRAAGELVVGAGDVRREDDGIVVGPRSGVLVQ
jgi:maltooligosyltrehalose trehalohydrolase